jgi:hypothetical protein
LSLRKNPASAGFFFAWRKRGNRAGDPLPSWRLRRSEPEQRWSDETEFVGWVERSETHAVGAVSMGFAGSRNAARAILLEPLSRRTVI